MLARRPPNWGPFPQTSALGGIGHRRVRVGSQFQYNVQNWNEDKLQQQKLVTQLSSIFGSSDAAADIGIGEDHDDAGAGLSINRHTNVLTLRSVPRSG